MYLTLIFIPLLGSIFSGLFGRKLGVKGSQFITCICLILSSFLCIIIFYEINFCNTNVIINLFSWVNIEIIDNIWNFSFDNYTISILLCVLIVSSLVHLFSTDYIAEDPHQQRFFSYLSLFTFFIVILVCGNNYLILFVGWEGIGVSSYLLINFWFTKIQANKSAIKALTVNRVGDIFLSYSFFGLFYCFSNFDYQIVFSISPYINEETLTIIGILFLFAAIGKSAQFTLHVWLPDSMEGPTPVSALIHAATLVTAGVYLLVRSSPMIEYAPITLTIITFVGAITAFFAASTGILQNDLKRIIAYSTCSQIGYLFISCGISQYDIALFHLVNHAFFKSLLFLCAGSVLHAINDQQDQRIISGLLGFLPFTYQCILIGSLSLIAFPFITGFYSKDLILEVSYASSSQIGIFAYYLGTITAFITAFYSIRIISITFLSKPNIKKQDILNSHDCSNIVIFCLFILSIFSIYFGYICKDLFVGIGSDYILFKQTNKNYLVEAEFSLLHINKFLPLYVTLLGSFLGIYLYLNKDNYSFTINIPRNNSIYTNFYLFFNGKYYIDIIYNYYINEKSLLLGNTLNKQVDKGIIETIGPNGLSSIIIIQSKEIQRFFSGNLPQYALFIIIGIITIIYIVFNTNINFQYVLLLITISCLVFSPNKYF